MSISFFRKSHNILHKMNVITPKSVNPTLKLIRYCHSEQYPSSNSSVIRPPKVKVGIFWDLDNKPPNSTSPYEAAMKLKRAVSSFGPVTHMVAYANHHAFSYVPPAVKELRNERKVLNHLENKGVIKPVEPYKCRVCGRVFNINEKLIAHFKIHEKEHLKRVNQIEAAKGKKRVNLVGRYAVKMDKYRNAVKDVLIPKVGYGLADDLKRAGFWVQTVPSRPQAADAALKNRIMDLIVHGKVQCVVLVSDDGDFVGVLKEARERCIKTVVVGDNDDGLLKRNADACFSWREILVGKAKIQAVSVLGRWRDRDVLKRLEWTYDLEAEKEASKRYDFVGFEDDCEMDVESGDSNGKEDESGDSYNLNLKRDRPWWELDLDTDSAHSNQTS